MKTKNITVTKKEKVSLDNSILKNTGYFKRCIIIGKNAGKNLTTAEDCIIIGKNAGNDLTNQKMMLVIKFGKQELRKKMTKQEYKFMKYILYGSFGYLEQLVEPFK